ncbi:MAG TPA: OprD family outer membrane porin [Gallionellaceae bacterium]|nr:OprD family outer membrane porin [Gallionellaceae bacterium]
MHNKFHCRNWALACALLAASTAYAEGESAPATDPIRVSGDVRLYSFSRNYQNSATTDLHSTSLGGKVKVETTATEGFGAAAALYFAQDIGFNNHAQNNKTINPLLMGTGYGIYVPGEAYVQYKKQTFLGRIGNQSIDTPWLNPSDGFMIPNLYRAGVFTYDPFEGLHLEGDRILSFKNRTSAGFDDNTLFDLPYSHPHFTGTTSGAAVLGADYHGDGSRGGAWLYRFYDIAQLAYVQGGYTLPRAGVSPFVDFQAMRETGEGAQLLGAVDSKAYGAKFGLEFPEKTGQVYFAYNKVPAQSAAGVSNGNLLSPYTQIYNTDPLYTTIMNYGLVSARAAGHAWQLGSKLKLFDGRMDASASFSRYMTEPYVADANAVMLDVAWHLSGAMKGLTLRDRFSYEHGRTEWGSAYLDNRIMLQYTF